LRGKWLLGCLVVFLISIVAIVFGVASYFVTSFSNDPGDGNEFMARAKQHVRNLEMITGQQYVIKNIGIYRVEKALFMKEEYYFLTVAPVNAPQNVFYVYERQKGTGSTKKYIITDSMNSSEQEYVQTWVEQDIIKTFSN